MQVWGRKIHTIAGTKPGVIIEFLWNGEYYGQELHVGKKSKEIFCSSVVIATGI